MKTNLWPTDIGQITAQRGPATLLKEQAALLAQLTKGLVEAEVRSGQDPDEQNFVDNFYVVGPTINYQYLLFTLRYPIEFYPAELLFVPAEAIDGSTRNVKIEDDTKLADEVRQIFSSEKTKGVISAIIARSK